MLELSSSQFEPFRKSAQPPRNGARCGQALTGTGRVECYGSGLAASEDVLLDDRVNAPITVNHLRDTEVNANRD
jgi:hypothetical protein